MTVFILVSDAFTGGWIWRDVAAGLREAGAEVHPVTLTGMGDRRHLAGPGTDLETHVQDLVQLIDHLDPAPAKTAEAEDSADSVVSMGSATPVEPAAPDLVLVGHGYGIHPVLGAADRRPDRVARIVHLDAGMPQDGDAAVALVPDRTVHELLADRAHETGTTAEGAAESEAGAASGRGRSG